VQTPAKIAATGGGW